MHGSAITYVTPGALHLNPGLSQVEVLAPRALRHLADRELLPVAAHLSQYPAAADDRGHPVDATRGLAGNDGDRPVDELAPRRARKRVPHFRRAAAVVSDRPRGLLGRAVGLLRHSRHAARARARRSDDARRRVVHRRSPQLRRAPGRPRGGPRSGRGRGALADARAAGADVRRADRAGRPGQGGAAAARGGARRPCGGVHAQHPRDADRLHRDREPRRDLGHMRARVRRAKRRRPVRPDRAARADRGRRLRLPRPLRRPPRRGRDDPRTDPVDRACGRGPVRRGPAPRRGRLGGTDRRKRAARVRAGRVRPPAVRAVLLGHDRAAEADRARSRRPADRAPQEPRALLGPQARRPPAVVLDDRLDDVERARRGPAAPLVDRDARRRPRVARPARAMAAGRGAPAVGDGRRAGVPDGVPQGRDPAGARVRSEQHPDAVHGGLTAATRGLPVRVRAARTGDAPQQRLGRDRRMHRSGVGQPRPAGIRGRDHRSVPGGRRARVRPRGQRGDRRARRARDHQADAVDAGGVLGRRGRRALPLLVLRRLPGRLAPGRLDQVHRARQLHRHRALRRDAEPRRRAPWHRRVLLGRRGCPRGDRRAGRTPRGRRRRRRRAAAVRGTGRRRRAR